MMQVRNLTPGWGSAGFEIGCELAVARTGTVARRRLRDQRPDAFPGGRELAP